MPEFENFDALQVPLEKKNLIEASAGTGKTFSIAVMVLRLILEKDINIKEILLVTFTNNAVAELDERIRLFIRQAFNYARHDKQPSGIIKEIVDRSVATVSKEDVLRKLNDSILFLDETSVMTIHGFCHQTLNDLAFETNQFFESELVTNFEDVSLREIKEFWRKYIVTLPVEILEMLPGNGFSQSGIAAIVKDYFGGKRFFCFNPEAVNDPAAGVTELLIILKEHRESVDDLFKNLERKLQEQKESLVTKFGQNTYAKKLIEFIDDTQSFYKQVSLLREKGYISKCVSADILEIIDSITSTDKNLETKTTSFTENLYCAALAFVTERVRTHIDAKGVQSYDDLIKNLDTALNGNNASKIISALKRKYKAAFVDEFQDTDKSQYNIFIKAFQENFILFLIGDPKQSIYAFRQADINTYFKAYEDTDKQYKMNVNFRSSEAMIAAMNQFFNPKPDFDFFYFGNQTNGIRYFDVSSPAENKKGKALKHGHPEKGISIICNKKKDSLLTNAAELVFQMLTDKDTYQIETSDGARNINPSDIGILVRIADYGYEFKKILGKYNIPSVFVAEEKIMKSDEAKELYQILKAIYDPAIENINAALINHFTGFSSSDALTFDIEKILELFRGYKQTWETQSIYGCLSVFISDFGVESHLTNPETYNGLRIISNLNQLMELLQKTAYHQHLNQAELLSWYRRASELEIVGRDESVIRLESDADAVTIMTIHKSKGLQFNFVLGIQMDMVTSRRDTVSLYENGEYISIPQKSMSETQEEDFKIQSEQEFRRLMYVSVSRAVYKAILYHNTNSYFKESALTKMIPLLENATEIEITDKTSETIEPDYSQKYQPLQYRKPSPAELIHPFELKNPFWRCMSYSGLSAQETFLSTQPENTAHSLDSDEYDNFIFKKLRRGNITGNMIHLLFQRIDFRSTENHASTISSVINRYAASSADVYRQWLPEMIDHVLHAKISGGDTSFELSEIALQYRVSEMEFDFTTNYCTSSRFIALLEKEGLSAKLKNNLPLHGLMKGFIDLLFLHDGKYYVLDWKTNFLGSTQADYEGENTRSAMEQLNYQLQFVLYTIAAKKYLMSRITGFHYDNFGGVIYCFIRGMRKGTSNGVYFYRPSPEMIAEIENTLTPSASVTP